MRVLYTIGNSGGSKLAPISEDSFEPKIAPLLFHVFYVFLLSPSQA